MNDIISTVWPYWQTFWQWLVSLSIQLQLDLAAAAIAVLALVVSRRAYRNLTYFNEVDQGGHFAAWEQPELLSEDVRAGFRPLRDAKATALNR